MVIPLPKKPYSSMRVWVQSPRSSNIHVCEFRLEFLSYIKKKKKKKKKKYIKKKLDIREPHE
jgi:hypothetical protein